MRSKPLYITTIFIFVFALYLLFSCNKEKRNTSNLSIAIADENYVTSEMALANAPDAFNAVLPASTLQINSTNSITKTKVKNIKDFLADDGLNAFYVVNFEGGGYSIISADRRTSKVLAYSDKNTLRTDTILPWGLQSWMSYAKESITDIRKRNIPYTGQDHIQTPGSQTLNNKIKINQLAPPDPDPNYCEDYTQTFGPLLQTQWGQAAGYNNAFPTMPSCNALNNSYYNYHVPTGCVATAVAQVFRYYQYPTTFNYSIMPNNLTFGTYADPGTNEISRLMYDIAGNVNMNYNTCGESSASPDDMLNAIKYTYGYSYSYKVSYNPIGGASVLDVHNSLSNNRPVIFTGNSSSNPSDAHAWVCDGSMLLSTCVGNGVSNQTFLFHMNWGEDPYNSANGWYAYFYFNPTYNNQSTHRYDTNLQVTYIIR